MDSKHWVTIMMALKHYENWLKAGVRIKERVEGSSSHFEKQLERVQEAIEAVKKKM